MMAGMGTGFKQLHSAAIKRIVLLTISAALVLLLASTALAQTPPQTTPPAQKQRDQEPLDTFKVDVSVVNIFFNVKDKHGALLPGLSKDDFEIKEDGVPQKMKYFS